MPSHSRIFSALIFPVLIFSVLIFAALLFADEDVEQDVMFSKPSKVFRILISEECKIYEKQDAK